MKTFVVAATQSGAGKTTIALAFITALKRRGLVVQPFKVGPDFIDPGHHTLAAGRVSHNLDGWMLSQEENMAIFNRHAGEADVAVIEGVMGLYDGFSPIEEDGSTAQMAKWLNAPVALVMDARAMARSVAAVAKGFAVFDPALKWAGLIGNRVGGVGHAALLKESMTLVPEMRFLGGLKRNTEIGMDERHLGLITVQEGGLSEERLKTLGDWLEEGIAVDAFLQDLPDYQLGPLREEPGEQPDRGVVIGVARDKAFCFYYGENLRRLEEAGARLAYFSPLEDRTLPAGVQGIYLGGGYPELFAERLTENAPLRHEISRLSKAGMPLYAECGGMMYLGEAMEDLDGRTWEMVGALPLKTRMLKRLRSLGYREVTFAVDTPLGPAGAVSRGHEFHYSEIVRISPSHNINVRAYDVAGRKGPLPETSGFMTENTLASYAHLHFGSNPALAHNFISSCRRWKG